MSSLRGTTIECLTAFLTRDDYDWNEALLAKFARVKPESVARWRRKGANPQGDELIRVRVFLELQGYTVVDFNIPDVTKQLARLVAYGVLNVSDLCQAMEYANPQDIYRVILRGSGLMPRRSFLMQELVDAWTGDIDTHTKRWQRIITAKEPIELEDRVVESVYGSKAKPVESATAKPPELQPSAKREAKPQPVKEPRLPAEKTSPRREDDGVSQAEFTALNSSVLTLVWALRAIKDHGAAAKRLRTAVPLEDLKVIQSFLSRATQP